MAASTARRGALALLLAALDPVRARVDRAGAGGDARRGDRGLRVLAGDADDHRRRHGDLDELGLGGAHRDEHHRRLRLGRPGAGRSRSASRSRPRARTLPVHAAPEHDRADRGALPRRRLRRPAPVEGRFRTSRCRRSGRPVHSSRPWLLLTRRCRACGHREAPEGVCFAPRTRRGGGDRRRSIGVCRHLETDGDTRWRPRIHQGDTWRR